MTDLDLDATLRLGIRRAIDAAMRERVVLPPDPREAVLERRRQRIAAGVTGPGSGNYAHGPRGGKHAY